MMENQIAICLEQICHQGFEQGVFSAVSAAVSLRDNGVYRRSFFSGGITRLDGEGYLVHKGTFFDLASLTKPLCTALCALSFMSEGKLRGDEAAFPSLTRLVPAEKEGIWVGHLLHHASGLAAYRPYFESFQACHRKENTELLIGKITEEKLEYPVGTQSLYSDLGFIILGALLEKKGALRLDALYAGRITGPVGLSENIRFFPLGQENHVEKWDIAATEACAWRGKVIHGEVHDEHCWLMGGVAGHAGLFGTVSGVLGLCEILLDCWKGRATHPAFASALLQEVLNTGKPDSLSRFGFRFGFDTPSPKHSSSGAFFSPQSIGHLGFSGTSFWIDPEKEVIIVLLTNRIHPTRANTAIKAFRPRFHDRIMEDIFSMKKGR